MAGPATQDHPSPNFGARRAAVLPDMVVIHHTAMASAGAALRRLCAPEAGVSAHYLIGEDGMVWRLVDEAARAWHAGAGAWGAVGDVNSRSIGIELANPGPLAGFPPFPEPQMRALEAVLAGVLRRWHVPPERVIAHSDMAPGRKADPGPKFDWRRLALAGLSVWPAPQPADVRDFAGLAAQAGYPVAQAGAEAVLAAFRLRFRPAATGPLAAADAALMAGLAARWPVAGSVSL